MGGISNHNRYAMKLKNKRFRYRADIFCLINIIGVR